MHILRRKLFFFLHVNQRYGTSQQHRQKRKQTENEFVNHMVTKTNVWAHIILIYVFYWTSLSPFLAWEQKKEIRKQFIARCCNFENESGCFVLLSTATAYIHTCFHNSNMFHWLWWLTAANSCRNVWHDLYFHNQRLLWIISTFTSSYHFKYEEEVKFRDDDETFVLFQVWRLWWCHWWGYRGGRRRSLWWWGNDFKARLKECSRL